MALAVGTWWFLDLRVGNSASVCFARQGRNRHARRLRHPASVAHRTASRLGGGHAWSIGEQRNQFGLLAWADRTHGVTTFKRHEGESCHLTTDRATGGQVC